MYAIRSYYELLHEWNDITQILGIAMTEKNGVLRCGMLQIHGSDLFSVAGHDFHFTMFGGTGFAFFAALHYWWPKMFGILYNFLV